MGMEFSRFGKTHMRNSASINWTVVGMVFPLIALLSFPAAGQTFLEKLEATVRQRLDAAQPTDNQAGANQAQKTGEELPAPQASRTQNANGQTRDVIPNPIQSVLENRPGTTTPATGLVPPLVLESGVANNAPADRRIYLGLEAEELTGGGIGVQVTNVTPDSPAWKGGFQRGDRIMGINGFAIANLDDMVQQLGKSVPGETVRFLVARNERNIELVAVLMEAGLAERIAGASLPIGDLSNVATEGPAWLGVMVNDLTPAFRNQFGLTVFRGAAVTTVSANSPAAAIGMIAGDAIISIDGVPIETAGDLMKWMSTARPGQAADVTYQRGSAARTARLTLEVSPENRKARSANRTEISPPQRTNPPNSSRYNVAPAPPVPQIATDNNQPLVPAVPNLQRSAVPRDNLVPNAIPVPNPGTTEESDVVELRREIATLKSELAKANQRLESTQKRLKQILDGLGNN